MTTDTEAPHIPDVLYDDIDAQARRTYTRHRSSIRGQQVTRADSFDTHLISHAYRAGYAAAKAETAWMPVAVLPAPCLNVIATYVNSLGNRRTIMAKWVPGKTEEAHSLGDEFGEYDEATDTTYVPEGWYEVIDNWDDYTFVAVREGVITHWLPLPEAPDAIRAGAKEPSDG